MKYTEESLEKASLEWLLELGYEVKFGPDCDPHSEKYERIDYSDVILEERFGEMIGKINTHLTIDQVDEVTEKVVNLAIGSPELTWSNQEFYQMLTNGIDVEVIREDGTIGTEKAWLIDRKNPENNNFLAINQFTVVENRDRRPDIVVFINGLPMAVFELKNLADENVGIKEGFRQFETYKTDIPSLFIYNQLLITSDGVDARVGTITADFDRFMRWRTIDNPKPVENLPLLEVLIRGVFDKKQLIDIISHFIVFEIETKSEKISKKLAAYHQYNAVNVAVERTIKATAEDGDRRCGVVWHTQGSGKSLSMLMYAGKLIDQAELKNPTIVMLTDRNDLDNQLFETFSKSSDILRQIPKQANSKSHLRELLQVASGGVIFTTIQKFLDRDFGPKVLSDRQNIVVIADEAHRSQYDFIDGFARQMHDALPNASFIGFTGTPIAKSDKDTQAVFGEYIDIYDIYQAVEDKATVPILYEGRLAKIELKEDEKPRLDADFEEITEFEETELKEKLKSKWSRLEALIGSEHRLKLIAKDLVQHFEERLSVIEGKGMIVVMSRRIAVDLYNEIIKIRPNWHSADVQKGFIKVVMTGSASDPTHYQRHLYSKQNRDDLADRMKDPKDEMKLVIVRDMWLTGFDCQPLHTMYVDKPMRGHNLMQAIARVNRVYKEKPNGLVVDYLGIATELKKALADYTKRDRQLTAIPQEDVISALLEKFDITKSIFYGFDYQEYFSTKSHARRTQIITSADDFILSLTDGKKRYSKAVAELSKAFAMACPHEKAMEIRDEVSFFQAVKASMIKITQSGPTEEDYDLAIKQIVSSAITSSEVVDIFKAVGMDKPNVDILSDEFLDGLKNAQYKNVALEALKRLLNDKINSMAKVNLVKSKSFAEKLEETIKNYQNKTIEAAQIIAELIELAKDIRQESQKGNQMGLSVEEVAFYDALADNNSAAIELGDKTLKAIAKELVTVMKAKTSVDWTLRDSVRAKIRIAVKQLLKKYNYPPDQQEGATNLVLDQAQTLFKDYKSE